MELADVVDSKSTAGDSVPVRVRPPAPNKTGHPSGVSCFIWYRVVYGGSRPAVFFASAKNTSAQGDPPSHGGALCPLDLGDGSSPTPLGCPVLFGIAWSMEVLDRPYFSPQRKIPAHKATLHPTAARCAPSTWATVRVRPLISAVPLKNAAFCGILGGNNRSTVGLFLLTKPTVGVFFLKTPVYCE